MEEYYNQQKKINDDEDKAYETDKIVDYSKNIAAEKKVTQAKKENTDYDIVTDTLEFDQEKNDDKKVTVVQKTESKPK